MNHLLPSHIDWAVVEALAFATLLLKEIMLELDEGQDVENKENIVKIDQILTSNKENIFCGLGTFVTYVCLLMLICSVAIHICF